MVRQHEDMEIPITFQDHIPYKHDLDLVLIADGIELKSNIGGLFRLSDAMGVRKLCFISNELSSIDKSISKIARSTDRYVDHQIYQNFDEIVEELGKDTRIFALEYTNKSTSIYDFNFQNFDGPVALIIGSEIRGVSKELLVRSESSIHIPMCGKNSSMNVVMAATIVVFDIIRQQISR